MNKLQNINSQIIEYNDGEIEIKVSMENDSVWITQKQLALLFEVETHTINYHIKNIFKEKELDKISTIRKIRIVEKEGNREVVRNVELENDVKQLKTKVNKIDNLVVSNSLDIKQGIFYDGQIDLGFRI